MEKIEEIITKFLKEDCGKCSQHNNCYQENGLNQILENILKFIDLCNTKKNIAIKKTKEEIQKSELIQRALKFYEWKRMNTPISIALLRDFLSCSTYHARNDKVVTLAEDQKEFEEYMKAWEKEMTDADFDALNRKD